MNKDVIYIEPEDDITDIITKIENSKSKIVALVPPKKAGVFRSIVNIKLIAKSGTGAGKTIVLVTADPSIMKLAAATKMPVAKDLKSAPVVPASENEEEKSVEEVREAGEEEAEIESAEETADDEKASDDEEESEDAEEDPQEEAQADDKKSAKKDDKLKSKKSKNKFIQWIKDHKKLTIFGGVGALALILFLVWALAIAPAATLIVEIKTDLNNFSEGVTFTTKLEEENAEEGKFYLEEKKVESTQEVNFEATGQKKVGEKATGEVIIYAYFPLNIKGTVAISAGEQFTISGLTYTADSAAALAYSGEGYEECDNKDNPSALINSGCQISGRVKVTAVEPGSNYNIAASNSGWSTTAKVGIYSDSAMSGGTDETITVVQQSDIDKARNEMAATDEAKNKEKLYEELSDDVIVIGSSFVQTTSEAVSTPALGEEVKEGEKPTLKATTVASIYVIDKTKVEEFITEKANLRDDQKIYEMKDLFIENFTKTDNGFSGKLKTSYATGPKITENDVVAIAKGKGLGEAQHDLRDISGVASVTINPSFPWVTTIPNDPNKITVYFEVKDQNGNKIEQKKDETENTEEETKKDTEKETEKDNKKDGKDA